LRNIVEHAQASRERTDNLVCEVCLDNGTIGYGEGVPRDYVTGEAMDASLAALARLNADALRVRVETFEQSLELVARVTASIPDTERVVYNATRSALELALLDAFSRAYATPLVPVVAKAIGLAVPPERPNLRYSLVANKRLLVDRNMLIELRDRFAYEHVKIKVGFGVEQDLKYIAQVRDVFGPSVQLRLDANRAWTPDEARQTLSRARAFDVHVVEDPLQGDGIGATANELRSLRRDLGVEVVLDEPVRTFDEAKRAIELEAVDVFNLRVSKCGGLLRTAAIAKLARENEVDCQIGSQVGESAILSAAGRLFASAFGSLRYLEGSNEHRKFQPEDYLSEEDLMYGYGGLGKPLSGLGLGITIRPERILRSSTAMVALM